MYNYTRRYEHSRNLLIFLVIGIFCISMVSAVWYLPWTWFQSPEENLQQEGKLFIIENPSEWNVLKATENESELTFWTLNAKDKKTELGWIPPDNNCDGWSDRNLYDENGDAILDDKNKEITLKCESSKCDGQNCYYISLTDAQSENIDEYVKLGEYSFVVEYQNISTLNYQLDWAEVNVTLYKNISGNYNNTVNDLFVYYNEDNYKFGANDSENDDLENYKYELKSTTPIYKEGNILYVQNPVPIKTKSYSWYENHDFDFNDICSRGFNAWNTTEEIEGENWTITHYNDTADCKFNSYEIEVDENNTDYYYEVTFISDKNIDPVISISDSDWITTSQLTNVTSEMGDSNHTHLNVSNSAPWDSLVGYWSFDGDAENTALTTAYDWSGQGNDGTYVDNATINSSGGRYGEGLVLDGAGDYVDLDTGASCAGLSEWSLSLWWKRPIWAANKGLYDESINAYWRNSILIVPNGGYTWYTRDTSTGDTGGRNNDLVGIGDPGDVAYGVWHHLVAVYSVSNSDKRIYADGISIGNTSTSIDAFTNTANTLSGLGNWPTSIYFNGTIDDVMIFNTSLTGAQILEIYNNQSARFLETGEQDIYNQSLGLNISTGNDRVNVSTQIEENMGSDINLTVGYYHGSWSATAPQTISSLTNYTFVIDDASTNLTLNYTFIAGNDSTSFYTPLILGDITFEAWASSVEDTTAPTWTLNQTNTTIANTSCLFSLYWNDDTALEPTGQYIFSTNNSGGTWTNDSAVNFTATPQWANVTKTLNDTVGIPIGWRMYVDDNAGNVNVSKVFSLTTTSADTCTYSGSGNWEVDCFDNCAITSNIDLMGNNISIIGTGLFTTIVNITNYTKLLIRGTDASNICRVTCSSGGCFRD